MYMRRYTDKLLEENQHLKKTIKIYESDAALAEMKALCDRRIQGAAEREKRNYDNWMNAVEANKDLKKRNSSLWKENDQYRRELKGLKRRNETLEKNDERRQSVLRQMQEERDKLKAENVDKDKQIEALKEEICRLKAQIDHDGTTNGIPTSKTPIGKKKVIPNTRQKSERKKGGQPGHEKNALAALDEEEVTETEDHTLDCCPICGGALEELDEAEIKDEIDYEVRTIKRRHRFIYYHCKECGQVVRASVPRRLKEQNQYGPELQAAALALVDLGFVSVNRAQKILTGILHNQVSPSEGFVGKVQKKAARQLQDFMEEAKEFCLTQRVLHWDDTVIFMNTSRACFRFYGNESVAYYTAHASKDAIGIEEDGILANLTEKTYLMHDHVKYNYRKEFLFKNIECIQHMERELERVFRASEHKWAEEMKKLIQETVHKRKEHLEAGINSFSVSETNQFEEKLENLLVKGRLEHEADPNRYYSTDEANALKKLQEYRWNYFAWVYDFTLPVTNNTAESGLRMTKTKQKVSGQFLKEETAKEFAAVRTYTETCRKNGVNEYEALVRLMAGNPYTMMDLLAANP